MIKVLSVASEMHPLVKTGGLADVVGALPPALIPHGVKMTTLIPGYPAVLSGAEKLRRVAVLPDFFGGEAAIRRGTIGEAALLVLDAPHLYDRQGNLYLGPDGRDRPDNPIRFAALAFAAAEIGRGLLPGFRPDVLHAHDWQAAVAPAYLHYAGGPRPKTVMTIHNLSFQGQYPPALLDAIKLPAHAFHVDGVEYYGMIGFLKAGLLFADRITTVSPRYAAEIKTGEAGMGLEGLLALRADALTGIVNGIDTDEWNPATDPHLAKTYDATDLKRRTANRAALETRFGLDADASPLFCVVSRLTWQKGLDILAAAVPDLAAKGARLALLGSGDADLEQDFRKLTDRHPGRVGIVLGYDEALAHQMFGGADMIVVPSRFEPCGLTQLYGLRYGCVPLAARVGGLADTIIDANDAALGIGAATGLQFHPVTQTMLEDALARALRLFADKPRWQAMQRRGMKLDLSWARRAGDYAKLYRELLEHDAQKWEPVLRKHHATKR